VKRPGRASSHRRLATTHARLLSTRGNATPANSNWSSPAGASTRRKPSCFNRLDRSRGNAAQPLPDWTAETRIARRPCLLTRHRRPTQTVAPSVVESLRGEIAQRSSFPPPNQLPRRTHVAFRISHSACAFWDRSPNRSQSARALFQSLMTARVRSPAVRITRCSVRLRYDHIGCRSEIVPRRPN